jgi:hypothetical protein
MIGKNLLFISKLPSYTLKHTLIRILLVGFTGFLFLFIAVNFSPNNNLEITSIIYLRVILIFIIGSEINVLIDNMAEHFFPIPEKIGLRIAMHLLFSVLFAWAAVFYFERFIAGEGLLKEPVVRLMIVLGGLFIFILLVVSIGLRITEKWLKSANELEELKQLKLMSDYNALQDQLNPHFLFNNLSILKSMIIYDQYSAVDFTQNFTDFYRYVLQSRGKTTVLLKDEIELLYSYIAIHKERLGENLQVKIDIGNDSIEKNIPPLSLQLLVENAIKHNIAGKENPLMIEVFTDTDSITVKNNLQPKESFYSTRNGLKNLVQRYKLIAEKEVEINQNEEFFTVKLPLL